MDDDAHPGADPRVLAGARVGAAGWPPHATSRFAAGISGWTYAPWRGTFYPSGLPHRLELAYAAHRLPAIEVNGSFYALQHRDSWRRWAAETPPGFVFAVRGPRFVTHLKQLRDVRVPVANFLASGLLALGPKLGPLLWQLPPRMRFDPGRLRDFLQLLPRTTTAAAALAAEHDERLDDRDWTTTDADRPLRHAVEVRHDSFAVPAFADLLREHDVALVHADAGGRWPELDWATAGHAYLRLHGAQELYASGYDAPAIDRWARVVAEQVAAGRPTVVFFDNDVKVRAPVDALALADAVDAA